MSEQSRFENTYLDVADFDGTMYDTFESAAAYGIYSVDEAYKFAIEKTFIFDKDALKKYEDEGEHNNRTPLEIVKSLVPNSTQDGLFKIASNLVDAKLEVLENQVGRPLADGTPWPRPLDGYVNYSKSISKSNIENPAKRIDRAIVSSGHASFIRKCINMSGLEQPEIMVTDETIRGLNSPLPPERIVKPSKFPLLMVKLEWLYSYGLADSEANDETQIDKRINVIGDSHEKDGGMANNGGVNFIHLKNIRPSEAWKQLLDIHGLVGQSALKRTAGI